MELKMYPILSKKKNQSFEMLQLNLSIKKLNNVQNEKLR